MMNNIASTNKTPKTIAIGQHAVFLDSQGTCFEGIIVNRYGNNAEQGYRVLLDVPYRKVRHVQEYARVYSFELSCLRVG